MTLRCLVIVVGACSVAAQPAEPLPAGRKLGIAGRDLLGWQAAVTALPVVAVEHAANRNPSFGQGAEGFSRRYGTALADHAIRNVLSRGVLAAAVGEDPRYPRKGRGTRLGRAGYALSRVVVCRRDSGRWGFNFAEVGGSAASAGIANAWYPDGRTLNDNAQRFGLGLAAGAAGNLLKEFGPDLRKWLAAKHGR